jgi:cell division initiation protein
VQLRSVLDALAEQVERLGHLPEIPGTPGPPQMAHQAAAELSAQGEIEWWNDLSSTPRPPAVPD